MTIVVGVQKDNPGVAQLVPFGPELWIAEGPIVSFYKMPYPTRMVVIRLSSGGLFIWSPVALDDDLKEEIDALGDVRHLVSPNVLHHLFLGQWQDTYPRARLFAPPMLSKRRRDLNFDAELDDGQGNSPLDEAAQDLAKEWLQDLDLVLVRGSFAMTEVVFFHRASRTAIFGDLIENFPRGWFKGWRGWLARLDGIVQPNAGAPREWRASFIKRQLARQALQRILSWNPERVIMAHGDVVQSGGTAFIRHSFRWLLGKRS